MQMYRPRYENQVYFGQKRYFQKDKVLDKMI
jgi:hypothetical protein